MGSVKNMTLRRIAAYIVFGLLTTVVNIAVFALLTRGAGMHYLIANLVAWVAAVGFAFVTNKIWVFDSPSFERSVVTYEAATFTASRLASGAMDSGMMFVLVGVAGMAELWAKVIVNVLVVVANYALSRGVVFRRTAA